MNCIGFTRFILNLTAALDIHPAISVHAVEHMTGEQHPYGMQYHSSVVLLDREGTHQTAFINLTEGYAPRLIGNAAAHAALLREIQAVLRSINGHKDQVTSPYLWSTDRDHVHSSTDAPRHPAHHSDGAIAVVTSGPALQNWQPIQPEPAYAQ